MKIQALPMGVELADIDDAPKLDLGTVYEDVVNNKAYRYVRNSSGSAVTFALGNSAVDMVATPGVVTADRSEAAQSKRASGIAISLLTPGDYGWVQIRGRNLVATTNGDDDMVVGDHMILGATDGDLDGIALAAALTDVPVGRVVVDEASAVVGIDLTLDWQ